jgi:hypothetical protein
VARSKKFLRREGNDGGRQSGQIVRIQSGHSGIQSGQFVLSISQSGQK